VIASILIASFPEKSFVFKPAERLANGLGQRQSQFHVSELISQVLFAQKSALPPFSQGDLKISLCKGRFRGILSAQRDFDESLQDGCLSSITHLMERLGACQYTSPEQPIRNNLGRLLKRASECFDRRMNGKCSII